MYGPWLVATDVLGRRLGAGRVARHAQRGMNAVEEGLINQETARMKAPSANIAPLDQSPARDRD